MNIRGASLKSVTSNKEINEIKQILGLESGKNIQKILLKQSFVTDVFSS